MKKYPIGVQTFEKIIEEDCLYVDKTELVYKLAHSDYNYVFLSRPRRFGKSLLLSTLESYFEGRKELFKGLDVEKLEKDWIHFPVIKIDLNGAKHTNEKKLSNYLHDQLNRQERKFGVRVDNVDESVRFGNLIETISAKYGEKVVVLIDEYDAALLDNIYNEQQFDSNKKVISRFYSNLKTYDKYIRFVFITGITKFSHLNIFSTLNNLTNISMDKEYAAICGITEDEMLSQMTEELNSFAERISAPFEKAVRLLKENYDGYHFTYPSPDIYNPFSLLTALSKGEIKAHWFETGTSSFVVNLLRNNSIEPNDILKGVLLSEDEFDIPIGEIDSVFPILYQSGYLTIKNYDAEFGVYALSLPNNEVKIGLFKQLLPHYIGKSIQGSTFIMQICKSIIDNDIDSALKVMKKVFASIPYCDNTDYEGHYQSLFCLIFTLVNQFVEAELRTSNGRVDIVVNNKQKLYIIEIKLDKSAQDALDLIERKDYTQKFTLLGLPIVKVGVNFNTKTRNIEEWEIV